MMYVLIFILSVNINHLNNKITKLESKLDKFNSDITITIDNKNNKIIVPNKPPEESNRIGVKGA